MTSSRLPSLPPAPAWQWLNVTGLDAALVAVGWQGAFARALGVKLPHGAGLVLGLSVWLAYLGDRWLDTRLHDWRDLPMRRQRFAARFRKELVIIWIVTLGLDLALALTALPRVQIYAGLGVLAACLGHTFWSQRHAARATRKELRVALIFGAGVGLCFVGLHLSPAQTGHLIVGLTAFTLAVFANCALIGRWEHAVDHSLGQGSLARALGAGDSRLRASAWITAGVGLISGFFFAPAWALGVYGLFLLTLDRTGWPRDLEARRCLADGTLMLLALALCL